MIYVSYILLQILRRLSGNGANIKVELGGNDRFKISISYYKRLAVSQSLVYIDLGT